MRKIAIARVDVDGYEGLVTGTKNLQKIFAENSIQATFFVNMGKEAGLKDALSHRSQRFGKSMQYASLRYGKTYFLRRLLLPKNLGHKNCKILANLVESKHDVQPHAWNHFQFTHNFEKLDLNQEISRVTDSYEKCLLVKPMGFAPPSFNTNEKLIQILKNNGYKFISSEFGGSPYDKNGIVEIPLSISRSIEEAENEKMSLESVFFKKMEHSNFYSFYMHADAEGLQNNLLNTLDDIIKKLVRSDYDFVTMKDFVLKEFNKPAAKPKK